MDAFDSNVKKYLSVLDNQYVSAALTLLLIIYAGVAAPKLPSNVAKWFDKTWFKLVVFFLIVYTSRKNVTVAIVAAVAVLISLMTLNKWKNIELMESVRTPSPTHTSESHVVPYSEGKHYSEEHAPVFVEEGVPVGVEEGVHSYQELTSEEMGQMRGVEELLRRGEESGRHGEEMRRGEESRMEESSRFVSEMENRVRSEIVGSKSESEMSRVEEAKVSAVLDIKAKQEEELGRELTPDEIRNVCRYVLEVLVVDGDVEGYSMDSDSYASV